MLFTMCAQANLDTGLQRGLVASIDDALSSKAGVLFMSYAVKPPELSVPADDPFQNDRLARRPTGEALSRLIGTIDGPCVVSLDAEWGMGKTTFLRMWQGCLCKQGFPVVMFNAWDNDFANEPFLALSEELREALGRHAGVATGVVEKLEATAKDVLVNSLPAITGVVVNLLTSGLGGGLAEVAVERVMALGDPDLSRYGKAKEAMSEFRAALAAAAEAQAAVEGVKPPLVVLIDELDRCRPSYAVELLEVLKHLFAVKGVVFVLAVNRSQLEHAVKALYGAEFGAAIYLRRFFDVELRLPAVGRDAFINAQVAAIWKQLHTIRGVEADGWQQHKNALDWARRFFASPELDFRTVQQALQRLGLVLAMLEGDPGEVMLTAMFTLILRTRDRDLYERFVNGEADDATVAGEIFKWVDQGFRLDRSGASLEAAIILAAMEIPRDSDGGLREDRSRLYSEHNSRLQNATHGRHGQAENRARFILQLVDDAAARGREGRYASFRDAVRRMELVAGDGP